MSSTPEKDEVHNLHVELLPFEWDLLSKVTNETHGAKSLLVRGLLRRFFKEQGLLKGVELPALNQEP